MDQLLKTRVSAGALSTNTHLLRWVEKMAELCKPAAIHWVDGSQAEYDALCGEMVAGGHLHPAQSRAVARLLPGAQRPERRRAGRGPHLHLLALEGSRRPDQQLGRPVRDARRR